MMRLMSSFLVAASSIEPSDDFCTGLAADASSCLYWASSCWVCSRSVGAALPASPPQTALKPRESGLERGRGAAGPLQTRVRAARTDKGLEPPKEHRVADLLLRQVGAQVRELRIVHILHRGPRDGAAATDAEVRRFIYLTWRLGRLHVTARVLHHASRP